MLITSTVTISPGESLLLKMAIQAFEEKYAGTEWAQKAEHLRAMMKRINDAETVESRHTLARRDPKPD